MTLLLIGQFFVLALSYIGIGLGYLPGLRLNRAAIAFVGAVLLIGLGMDLETAWQAIDANTICFLLGMMIVNANLASAGVFSLSLSVLLQMTQSPFGLMVVLSIASGVLSAFFLNDTLVMVFTPLTISLTQTLNLSPVPYLLAIAAATNIGSVATLSGNPQNILVGSFSGIHYLDFARSLTPIAIAGLVLQIGWLWLLYPDVRSIEPLAVPKLRVRLFKPLLLKSLIVTAGLLVAFVAGAPLGKSALLAATLLLVTRRLRSQRSLERVDWNLLLMFSSLFVLTRATEQLNLLQGLTDWVANSIGLLSVTAVLSNLISNVPAVLVLHPLIAAENSSEWLMLAAASTLAGNLTLLGSIANLIVVEAAATLGYQLSFWEHLRFGLPLTLLTLGFAYFWLR
ncbi:anion transporter [Microcoleus sp. FACHB-1515]|uniref:anion transporter n=1 Tax=Cyanophyceae TaxID=3028117 RepID=UPI0028C4CD07|nr:anion transporter [Microcoleus sp. FACHB-1515]